MYELWLALARPALGSELVHHALLLAQLSGCLHWTHVVGNHTSSLKPPHGAPAGTRITSVVLVLVVLFRWLSALALLVVSCCRWLLLLLLLVVEVLVSLLVQVLVVVLLLLRLLFVVVLPSKSGSSSSFGFHPSSKRCDRIRTYHTIRCIPPTLCRRSQA